MEKRQEPALAHPDSRILPSSDGRRSGLPGKKAKQFGTHSQVDGPKARCPLVRERRCRDGTPGRDARIREDEDCPLASRKGNQPYRLSEGTKSGSQPCSTTSVFGRGHRPVEIVLRGRPEAARAQPRHGGDGGGDGRRRARGVRRRGQAVLLDRHRREAEGGDACRVCGGDATLKSTPFTCAAIAAGGRDNGAPG